MTTQSCARPLDGKVAIVTGAGRSIGRAEALLLAAQGAAVVVNDLGGGPQGGGGDRTLAETVAEEIRASGGQAVADPSDVSSITGGAAVVARAIEAFGRIDILINNAGIIRPGRIDDLSETDWDLVLAVNLKACFATIKAAAPHFIAQEGGCIVNTASPSGFGHYGMTNYSAAKEGVVGLTRSLARDLGQFGVRSNVIRPVSATTNMNIGPVQETIRYSLEVLKTTPFWNRPFLPASVSPEPEHVAAIVAWLCTSAAQALNGRELFISGSELGILPEPELERVVFARDGWTLDGLQQPGVADYLLHGVTNRFGPERRSISS